MCEFSKRGLLWILLSLAVVAGDVPRVSACTRVFWNVNRQAMVVGRTMDLYTSDRAKLVFYPRGFERDGMAGQNSARWKAKYASLVLTAFDNCVTEGLNEYGLATHILYLAGTQYEVRDERPGLANSLWAQYPLDNCKLVAEASRRLGRFKSFRSWRSEGSGRSISPWRTRRVTAPSSSSSMAKWLCIMASNSR